MALAALWSAPALGQARSAKIEPQLAQTLNRITAAGVTRETLAAHDLEGFSTPLVRVDPQGRIQVYIQVGQLDEATLGELRAAGVAVETTSPQYRIVQGWIPFDLVEDVAALQSVQRIRPPDYAVPRGRSR